MHTTDYLNDKRKFVDMCLNDQAGDMFERKANWQAEEHNYYGLTEWGHSTVLPLSEMGNVFLVQLFHNKKIIIRVVSFMRVFPVDTLWREISKMNNPRHWWTVCLYSVPPQCGYTKDCIY